MGNLAPHTATQLIETDLSLIPIAVSNSPDEEGVKQSQGRTSIWKPVPPPPPPWDELPEDITAKILQKLGPVELILTAQRVCSSWRKICRDPSMWRVIDMFKLGDVGAKLPYDYKLSILSSAMELSQGQVTEINLRNFADDHILDYVLESCGQLRCLRFAFCDDLTFESFSKSKGLPLLEEVHIQFNNIGKGEIEAICRACPMLKSFSMNFPIYEIDVMDGSIEVLPIAKFMPELRHLQLLGNNMSKDVLEAILNGCPKLESLDLRECSYITFEGELLKRCAKQIKTFWGPHDPLVDYEWYDYWVAEKIYDQQQPDSSDDSDFTIYDSDFDDQPSQNNDGGQ